jgi:putative glycosyl hydrolase-like family 15 (GHL15) protein
VGRALRSALVAVALLSMAIAAGCSSGARPLAAPPAGLPTVRGTAPRLAVVWLAHHDIDPVALARFDLVVLDMEWAHRDPAALRRIRSLNPMVTLLAYVGSEEIMDAGTLATVGDGFRFRKRIAAGIDPSWYLLDGRGHHAVFYPGTWMLNPSTGWARYLADFVHRRVLGSGLFSGVYYDNAWASPSWLQDGDVDLDRDGRADGAEHGRRWIADTWNRSIVRLFARTRRLDPGVVMMGNGSAAGYEDWGNFSPTHHEYLDGALDEHWPTLDAGWADAIRRQEGWMSRARPPAMFLEQADTDRDGDPESDLRGFRYALASALLTESHFAYDRGDHGQQQWWYDEYDDLGRGRGYLGAEAGDRMALGDGVWAREFAHGIAVVNPTDSEVLVRLPPGSWRFIAGKQDPQANPGGPAHDFTLAARDGRILLRAGKAS